MASPCAMAWFYTSTRMLESSTTSFSRSTNRQTDRHTGGQTETHAHTIATKVSRDGPSGGIAADKDGSGLRPYNVGGGRHQQGLRLLQEVTCGASLGLSVLFSVYFSVCLSIYLVQVLVAVLLESFFTDLNATEVREIDQFRPVERLVYPLHPPNTHSTRAYAYC
jgi:hypothetical protein